MKVYIIALLLLMTFRFEKGFSQCFGTEKKDSTDIYLFSLMKYCDQYLGKTSLSSPTILVENNYFITEGLPDNVRGYKVRYVYNSDIKSELSGKKNVTVVRIVPLMVKGDDFSVSVIPFSVTYSKKNFNYVNGGGLGVSFEYDTQSKCLTFKECKRGNI
ncbi:hypothetical protein BH10BAC4_BH10BAC4_24140 [soil metagenome]